MKIKGLSDKEIFLLRATLGRHKKNRHLTPLETADLLKKALSNGESKRDLSNKVNISADMVSKFVKLCSIKEITIRTAIEWSSTTESSISMSTAVELARLTKVDDERLLFGAIKENKLSKSEVKELITLYTRSKKTLNESIQQIIDSKPQVVESHLIIGEITSKSLSKSLKKIPGLGRNRLFRKILTEKMPSLNFKSAKLKTKQFIIFGDNETKLLLISLENGFEEYITDLLIENLPDL